LVGAAVISTALIVAAPASVAGVSPVDAPARQVEAVVLTGAQLPGWSGVAADGVANPHPTGMTQFGTRDAHNGHLVYPPVEAQTGVDPDSIAAFAWTGKRFEEVPVQVDERFPYFLSNANSSFGDYSGVDKELTYEWDVESWKKTAGRCEAQYPDGESAMEDPVVKLDDDDEIVFMASDAAGRAPLDAAGPPRTGTQRQEVRLVDPRDPSKERFVYLFARKGGSSFTKRNGYVRYQRDANADEWIDRKTFKDNDPEKLGTSNTGYGPNLSGTVCTDDKTTPGRIETHRRSDDRFPRDGVTVSTDTYRWRASGRWMVRRMHVTTPGAKRAYGPDLIDRWKGRAFQQSPDSSISLVGFEDEQVNWEANSALLGELAGPVRAIRETWGADSGTNVTKTETFYRDAITYRYRVRVHPIPPDGLYTSWDYNHDVVATYYNETKTDGVPIDGQNDESVGNVDEVPCPAGAEQIPELGERLCNPAFFDAPDPTFTKPLAFLNWEQVSGRGDTGSLVYMFELKGPTTAANPAVVPYYRDDSCLDDGTGDDPSPRPMPGDRQDSIPGYLDHPCYGDPSFGDRYSNTATTYRQGCFGCHGVHFFVTHDSDNVFGPVQSTEIDGQQWQWAVPTESPENVGDRYANTVKTPLVPFAVTQPSTPSNEEPPHRQR